MPQKIVEMVKKSFDTPDETRMLPQTRVDLVNVGDHTVMRGTFEPGWHWAEHIKPKVGTDQCEVHHLVYVISGSMHVKTRDGSEIEMRAGDVVDIPAGHDAWVTSDGPAVILDFTGGEMYAHSLETEE